MDLGPIWKSKIEWFRAVFVRTPEKNTLYIPFQNQQSSKSILIVMSSCEAHSHLWHCPPLYPGLPLQGLQQIRVPERHLHVILTPPSATSTSSRMALFRSRITWVRRRPGWPAQLYLVQDRQDERNEWIGLISSFLILKFLPLVLIYIRVWLTLKIGFKTMVRTDWRHFEESGPIL